MKKTCAYPRRRKITGNICIFLCLAGAFNCLTHLFVYLDVLIFDLGMFTWDLVLLSSYVLMTIGAFKMNFALSGVGASVITIMKIADIIKELCMAEGAEVSEEIYALMAVDVSEMLGLLFGTLVIFSRLNIEGSMYKTMSTIWFSPAMFFSISVVGSLFSNMGVLSDKTVTMFFLGLACLSYSVWCTNPEGLVDLIAQRLRENEETE